MRSDYLAACVQSALSHAKTSDLPLGLRRMPGHTSPLQREFLNKLCYQIGFECRYLEVGIFQGASLLSAQYQNGGCYYGVDDFRENSKQLFEENRANWAGVNVSVLRVGFRESQLPGAGINVFFHDANTDDDCFIESLHHFQGSLADSFIWIVDNWSRAAVRANTRLVMDLEMQCRVSYELTSENDCDIDGWWSGWMVAVMEKKKPRLTTQLRGFKENEVPIWDIEQRREMGLNDISKYK